MLAEPVQQMKTEQVTIDTIAVSCGLSRTTVSAVLRGEAARYRIAAATAARVAAAADAAGWKPNFFARALNRKRTGTIGVLFPDVFERFMGETVRGIEEALAEADCRMLLSTSRFDPDEELRAIEAFAYRGVDGLLWVPYAPFSVPGAGHAGAPSATARLIAAIGDLPCVLIDRVVDGLDPRAAGFGTVLQADRQAAREATAALFAAGSGAAAKRRSIGFIGFDLAASSTRDRRAGYRDAAAELGFAPCEILLYNRDPFSHDLADALDRALADRAPPSGWLVSTEGLGYRVAALLAERGFAIGGSRENDATRCVSLARFGTDPVFWPTGLWGLRQPHRELGLVAARRLFERIDGRAKIDRDAHKVPLDPIIIPVALEMPHPPLYQSSRTRSPS